MLQSQVSGWTNLKYLVDTPTNLLSSSPMRISSLCGLVCVLSQTGLTLDRKPETNERSWGAPLSSREASASSLLRLRLRLWLGPRSPCQHMSWPRVLTAARRGFHQAPRDLPAVQTTATLIVHCAAAFVQSASRIRRSLTPDSILKVSYHRPCQAKPVPRNTHSEYISPPIRPSRCFSENKIVDVTDMRSLTKLIPGSFLASRTPASLRACRSGEGPRATRFCSLCYMCCQANCLPCTLWFWTGVLLWSSPPASSVQRHTHTHPARLQLAATSRPTHTHTRWCGSSWCSR